MSPNTQAAIFSYYELTDQPPPNTDFLALNAFVVDIIIIITPCLYCTFIHVGFSCLGLGDRRTDTLITAGLADQLLALA